MATGPTFTKLYDSTLAGLIKSRLSGREWDIAMFVIHRATGYYKVTEVPLSLGDFARWLNMERGNVSRTIQRLVDRGIILKRLGEKETHTSIYSYEQDPRKWRQGTADIVAESNEAEKKGEIEHAAPSGENSTGIDSEGTNSLGSRFRPGSKPSPKKDIERIRKGPLKPPEDDYLDSIRQCIKKQKTKGRP